MGGAVLIIVAIYGLIWLVAIVGGLIMLFYIVRSLLKRDWLMACLQIAFAVILILPAPAVKYYLTTTLDAADKARRERDAGKAARQDAELKTLRVVSMPTPHDSLWEQARRDAAEQRRLREQRRAGLGPSASP